MKIKSSNENSFLYVSKKFFPPFLDSIIRISPKKLIKSISPFPRIMCQHCGLWNRAILCPPLLYQTYPQFSTIESSKDFFSSFTDIYLYIFKNDGTKRWWMLKDQEAFKHLKLRKQKARQLKGCEASSARQLTKMMRKVRTVNTKRGFECFTFISGHCDFCARKCPNRENPPCKRGGLPSLEAAGINVYHLLTSVGVPYEYPVINYLTLVNMMAVKRNG